MKSLSDDDEEITPDSVTNYHFVDNKDEPVSYFVLPLRWSDDADGDGPQTPKKSVFLHGEAGIDKIHRQVTAWRLDLSGEAPEVFVLAKDNKWIKLVKPRKSFEEEIRTISIVVQCLHYLRRNPEAQAKSLWEHVQKVFSTYEIRPSEADVVDHLRLIDMIMKRDEVLATSKVLVGFLEDKPKKRKASAEGSQADLDGFIVDDAEDEGPSDMEGIDDDDEESDLFDTVCALCDNGGELLCCEGICMRSFHPTEEAGEDSDCISLGYTDTEVKAIQNFLCLNCQFKKHQCYVCGKLGSSDKSVGAEDFLLQLSVGDYLFLIKLLISRDIIFEDSDNEEDITARAWDGLLPNRILIYCLKHQIDEGLGTPIRNHIKFPDVPQKKKACLQELPKNVLAKKKKAVSEIRDLMRSSSSLTLEEIVKRHDVPSTHACFSRPVDKTITMGKVDGSIEAVRTALQKLDDGCSIEDAKAVCEPEIVNQIIKWRNRLKVYLAPFLHGMRYTSFGRHFTKKEKLQEIVDFCCGANDFSCFMKQKLDETGKKCLFRNYDLIQPKIMGLNPPFGVKACLANKFIDKALQFKPKLLILIVPEETERLDKKNRPEYDLIWEDCTSLSGKSFYLPGSVDVKDKQMEQWNVKPPVLYLWSHKNWTQRHWTIAERHGHTSRQIKESCPAIEEKTSPQNPDQHKEEDQDVFGDLPSILDDIPGVEEQTIPAKPISHSDQNVRVESGSSKQKKRPAENLKERHPARSKKSKKPKVVRRPDDSRRELPPVPPASSDMSITPLKRATDNEEQPSSHLTHNVFTGPSHFTEDPYSSGLRNDLHNWSSSGGGPLGDMRSMSPIAMDEWFPRYGGSGGGGIDGMSRAGFGGMDDLGHMGFNRMAPPQSLPPYPFPTLVSRAPPPSYGMSATQRYAPRLEETNFAPLGMSGRADMYDLAGRSAGGGSGGGYPPPDVMGGYMHGQHRYPGPGSGTGGWLND
ncbi:hypothetical protein QJS10_CPA05g00992 [Acorus calamus]|uniref:DNA (cytosine-5)-methyltransferase 1 replication foci domain-containing protein n=1 Tax=Acorus calamus TaxID=4465 RepID=A0AAV9EV25_ACOCL|nr:hypothetical protein QJS10_CPA05g00992 [Acorus calamus]